MRRISITRHTAIAVAMAILVGLTVAVAATTWSHIHIDNNDGMSNSSVNVIFQDRNEILWIGTWDGLNRYDGNHIVQYRAISRDTTTLSNPVVRDIFEEDDNYLWVVTDMGINRLNRRTGTFRRFYLNNEALKGGYTEKSFHCAYNGEGLLLACRDKGKMLMFNRDKQSFEPIHVTRPLQESIRQMCFSDKNHLTVVTDHLISVYTVTAQNQLRLKLQRRIMGTPVFDHLGRGYIQSGKEICRLAQDLTLEHTGMMVGGTLTAVSTRGNQIAVASTDGYYLFTGRNPLGHYMEGTGVTALFYGTQGIAMGWYGRERTLPVLR